eukprot:678540_1
MHRKVIDTMGLLPQRFSPHDKGHSYIVMGVQTPLSASLSLQSINAFKKILPQQTRDDESEDEEKQQPQTQTKPQPQRNNKGKRNHSLKTLMTPRNIAIFGPYGAMRSNVRFVQFNTRNKA